MNAGVANKLYHHMILTQKLILLMRKKDNESVPESLIHTFIQAMPQHDQTQIVFWDNETLNKIDSPNLI